MVIQAGFHGFRSLRWGNQRWAMETAIMLQSKVWPVNCLIPATVGFSNINRVCVGLLMTADMEMDCEDEG